LGAYSRTKGECMLGRIYADAKCPRCGSTLKSIEPQGMTCKNPACSKCGPAWYKDRCRVVFDNRSYWHETYREAYKLLSRLRSEVDKGSYDRRDYLSRDKPLSFSSLAWAWLDHKAKIIKPDSLKPLRMALTRATAAWGERNIKTIAYADVDDLLQGPLLDGMSPKSKKHTLDTLKQLWAWAVDRLDIPPMRKWPKLGHVEMAFRQTVDLETQEAILDDIKAHEPFRVWLCARWLATYIAVRPGEMRSLTEGQVDRVMGRLVIPYPKEKRAKIIPLTKEDIQILKGMPLAFDPAMPFFRHESKGALGGKALGHSQLYRAWKRACERLGVEGVSIYPGTKHSTACGLRAVATPEEIKALTLHSTGAAFNRYFMTGGEDYRELAGRRQQVCKNLASKKAASGDSQVIDFSKK